MGGSSKNKRNLNATSSHSKSPTSVNLEDDPLLKWAVECTKVSKAERELQISKPTTTSRSVRDAIINESNVGIDATEVGINATEVVIKPDGVGLLTANMNPSDTIVTPMEVPSCCDPSILQGTKLSDKDSEQTMGGDFISGTDVPEDWESSPIAQHFTSLLDSNELRKRNKETAPAQNVSGHHVFRNINLLNVLNNQEGQALALERGKNRSSLGFDLKNQHISVPEKFVGKNPQEISSTRTHDSVEHPTERIAPAVDLTSPTWLASLHVAHLEEASTNVAVDRVQVSSALAFNAKLAPSEEKVAFNAMSAQSDQYTDLAHTQVARSRVGGNSSSATCGVEGHVPIHMRDNIIVAADQSATCVVEPTDPIVKANSLNPVPEGDENILEGQ